MEGNRFSAELVLSLSQSMAILVVTPAARPASRGPEGGDSMTADPGCDRLDQIVCSPAPAGKDRSEWPGLFQHLRDRINRARTGSTPSSSPTELALSIVAEALAIGEVISAISTTPTAGSGSSDRSPGLYAGIDSHYLDRRTRALRAALHGVDDYIWWGGLEATAHQDRSPSAGSSRPAPRL